MISQKATNKMNKLLSQEFEVNHIHSDRIDFSRSMGNTDLEIAVYFENGRVETLFEDDGSFINNDKQNTFSGLII